MRIKFKLEESEKLERKNGRKGKENDERDGMGEKYLFVLRILPCL